MQPSFRDATRDDIPTILQLCRDGAVPGQASPAPATAGAGHVEVFALIAANPDHRLVVCEAGGEIVGTLMISFLPDLARGAWRGQLENVHIRADRRGTGLGTTMIEWAVARCRERGCSLVQLTSNKARGDAHRFYQRLGFEASHEGMKLKL